ncbi:MAG: hypothetical protein AVDCRST_MAG66-2035, partial [uncultured Pseudonocardia sp.]
ADLRLQVRLRDAVRAPRPVRGRRAEVPGLRRGAPEDPGRVVAGRAGRRRAGEGADAADVARRVRRRPRVRDRAPAAVGAAAEAGGEAPRARGRPAPDHRPRGPLPRRPPAGGGPAGRSRARARPRRSRARPRDGGPAPCGEAHAPLGGCGVDGHRRL